MSAQCLGDLAGYEYQLENMKKAGVQPGPELLEGLEKKKREAKDYIKRNIDAINTHLSTRRDEQIERLKQEIESEEGPIDKGSEYYSQQQSKEKSYSEPDSDAVTELINKTKRENSQGAQPAIDDFHRQMQELEGANMSGETTSKTSAPTPQSQVQPSPDYSRQIEAANQAAKQYTDRQIQQTNQRIAQTNGEIQGLKTGIKDLEVRTSQQIKESNQQLKQRIDDSEQRQSKALNDGLNQVRSETSAQFDKQRTEYTGLINQERSERLQAEKEMRSDISGLQSDVSDLRSDVSTVQAGLSSLQSQVDWQRSEYTELIAEQSTRFNQLVARERATRQQQMAKLNLQLAGIQATETDQRNFANDLFSDVQQVWRSIASSYRHQKFAPGKMSEFGRSLESCQQMSKQKMWQAIVSTAQQVYFGLADLRLQLVHKEQEWVLRCGAMHEQLLTLGELSKSYRKATLEVGEDEEKQSVEIDANFWTNGKLDEFDESIASLQKRLESEQKLTPEQLTALETEVDKLPCQLNEIVEQAKLCALSSQLRVNMAYSIASGLERMGYRTVSEDDATFEGDDPRSPLVLKMQNVADESVVAVITPTGDFGINQLAINTFSNTADQDVYDQNRDAIVEALQENGVDVERTECREHPDQRYRDIDAVRNRPAQIQIPQVG